MKDREIARITLTNKIAQQRVMYTKQVTGDDQLKWWRTFYTRADDDVWEDKSHVEVSEDSFDFSLTRDIERMVDARGFVP